MTPHTATPQQRRELVALQILVALFLLLRLYFDLNADLVAGKLLALVTQTQMTIEA